MLSLLDVGRDHPHIAFPQPVHLVNREYTAMGEKSRLIERERKADWMYNLVVGPRGPTRGSVMSAAALRCEKSQHPTGFDTASVSLQKKTKQKKCSDIHM